MFKLSLKDEDILVKITVRKPVTNKEVVNNFIGNILTGAGGDIADKVYLILTNDTLYLEYAEEIRNVDNISLSDLKEFLVTSNKNEELIEIKTSRKDFLFIRDNTNEDNLALAMSKVINDIKFNI